jgi:extradiol dioxygenase family protein
MRANKVEPGMTVETKTINGRSITCTVVEPHIGRSGEWWLESPTHGYRIVRHHAELREVKDEGKVGEK